MSQGFQFHNDIAIYHQIHSVCLIQLYVIPIDWQGNLSFYLMSFQLQKIFQGCLVSRFQQAIVVFAMNLHRHACYLTEEPVSFIVFLH